MFANHRWFLLKKKRRQPNELKLVSENAFFRINIGIKHEFPFINIRKVPRDLANVNLGLRSRF